MIKIKNNLLKISVRSLVEFLCQSGDIDNRFGKISDKDAMEAGSRAHRKIQKSMGPEYQSEVPLKLCIEGEQYNISVEGRADGIFQNDEITYIDEIKGTFRDLHYLNEAAEVHKAQAMCYAYFYLRINSYDRMGVRITYVNLETEEIKYFEEVISSAEIEKWFGNIISELKKWGDFVFYHTQLRNETISELPFPYEYRDGQYDLAANVYKSIRQGKNLFIQAPTGVGKTISTIYPSVKAMGSGMVEKIFYLTAKTITRTAAQSAYIDLTQCGLNFKTVTITAKEKICFQENDLKIECNPIACPYAKGHYDRINEAVFDIITHENIINRQIIEEYAYKHQVCPFEFSLDISYWMDSVICDYNYVFDPHVCLKRFFSEGNKGDYVFLVDEAHNLVDRAREMYSASICKEEFLEVKHMIGTEYGKRIISALDRCNRNLLELKRQCENDYMVLTSDDTFALNMERLGEEISVFMEKNKNFPNMKELSQFFFKVKHYNEMHEALDENYLIYTEHTKEGFVIRLFCVNPSVNLAQRIGAGINAVFFSATLLPVNYYKKLLSGNSEEYAVYAHSVFDVNKRKLIIGRDVTSRYVRRTDSEYKKICKYISEITNVRRGNYLVFFPSYKYLSDVYGHIEPNDSVKYIIQQQNMTEQDKEIFLEEFSNTQKGITLIGMCVMGGVFSEGIDLKKDSLIGVIIVGTGLPSIDIKQQLLRQFFDEKEGCGYEYAFVYPGMNKVLQAAGRVIRTEEDCGVIALLDDRFLSSQYKMLFPREWSNYVVTDIETVGEEILDFWNNMHYNEK